MLLFEEKNGIISKTIYLFHSVSHSFNHFSTLPGEDTALPVCLDELH